jgi:hypothetical protein
VLANEEPARDGAVDGAAVHAERRQLGAGDGAVLLCSECGDLEEVAHEATHGQLPANATAENEATLEN